MWSPIATLGEAMDLAITRTQHARGRRDPILALSFAERRARLEQLISRYDSEAVLDPRTGLYGASPSPAVQAVPGTGVFGRFEDLTWESAAAPHDPDLAAAIAALPTNLHGHARFFPAAQAGPVVIAIHGYGAGHLDIEPILWPTRAWRRAGWSVAYTTLPLHGRRAPAGKALAPPFPSADMRLAHEGFRQAILDLDTLVDSLQKRGYGPFVLAGMSLGGYVAALAATLRNQFAGLAMVIPLGSLPDWARSHGRFGSAEEADVLHPLAERVYRPSSPDARPSRIPSSRTVIVAASSDRITGLPHANRLGAHFGVDPVVCRASHSLQAYGPGWKAISRMMSDIG